MKAFRVAMDVLHRGCLWGAAIGMLVLVAIIPYGVFTRYVLGRGSQWPEPMAVLVMIVVSMLSAAVCYRDGLHIAVLALPDRASPRLRRSLGRAVELSMLAVAAFMVVWGAQLCSTTWAQSIPEFPSVPVGASYLPIPVAGVIVALFAVEKLASGRHFVPAADGAVAAASE